MKSLAILLLIALPFAFAANLKSREYYEYAFETYRREFGKEYATADEHVYRMQIFANNLDIVLKHNAGYSTYTMGINDFSDMTVEEFKNAHFCGCFNGIANKKNYAASHRGLRADQIDWTEKGAVTPVKDQGQCGSCWAFSATGSLESANFLKTSKLIRLSEQQLVDCSTSYGNEGCNGGLMDLAFDYVLKSGICSEEDYPYTAKDQKCKTTCKPVLRMAKYIDVEPNEKALAEAVTATPISVALNASPIMGYHSGIFDGECDDNLNHGVLAVGFGTEKGVSYWKLKNSWGNRWGEKGYFRIIKDLSTAPTGECGIAAASSYPVV